MHVYWFEQTLADVPHTDEWLSLAEQAQLSTMRIPKRHDDWRLGRWTAKSALASYLKLDHRALPALEVRPKPTGAPKAYLNDAPLEAAISLTHRSGMAACAIAPKDSIIGCDVECIEPHTDSFISDYFTSEEQDFIGASTDHRDLLVTLFWSAKESALKALGVGLRENLRTLSVAAIDSLFHSGTESSTSASNSYHPGTWHVLIVTRSGRRPFRGSWQQSGQFLRTLVTLPSTDSLSYEFAIPRVSSTVRPHWP